MAFGRYGPFDNTPTGSHFSTFAGWNTTLYPVLNSSLTGVYRCRTDTDQSLAIYQLSVRGKMFIFISITVFPRIVDQSTIFSTNPDPCLLFVHGLYLTTIYYSFKPIGFTMTASKDIMYRY